MYTKHTYTRRIEKKKKIPGRFIPISPSPHNYATVLVNWLNDRCYLIVPADKTPSKEWPGAGNVVFKNFKLRYSDGSPYVLKNLNFQIHSKEKVKLRVLGRSRRYGSAATVVIGCFSCSAQIGIVGRTGAGKSSIIAALFRLALNEGSIKIDDVEIHELGLHDLRSKLSIIPQEPVLFSGTMRKNLDPFDEYADHVLWNALDEVK